MNNIKLIQLDTTTIRLIDGDRGVNYPNKKDFTKDGYCIFLESSNLTKNGFNFSSKLFISKDKDQAMGKGRLQRGDLVINTRGTIGNIGHYTDAISYDNIRINSGMLIIRGCSDYDNGFLYCFLRSKLFFSQVENIMSGSVQDQLPIWILNSVKIPELDILSQRKIASVISALDSKIELNKRINAELESMAKTLYDYWFVQYEFPNAKGKPYRSSGGKMVYNPDLKREIPENWLVYKVGELLHTSLGGTPSTDVKHYWENGTINWLNSGEIANFPIVGSELKITEAAIRNSATELLPKGSTLLSITRHLRPTVLAIDACANQSVVGIREKDDIKYYFLYPYLKNEIPRFLAMRTGAQQPHINKEIVDESQILIPNEGSNVLKIYNSKVRYLYELIINNTQQNQKLAELRDWLLPMLMNGQVKVN